MEMKNPWVIYVPAEILAAYNRCNIFNTNILGRDKSGNGKYFQCLDFFILQTSVANWGQTERLFLQQEPKQLELATPSPPQPCQEALGLQDQHSHRACREEERW